MEYTNTSVPGVVVGIGTMQNTEAEFLKLLREKKKTSNICKCASTPGKNHSYYMVQHIFIST